MLDKVQADMFHHNVAKLLFLCKRARPDKQTAVAFLCTNSSCFFVYKGERPRHRRLQEIGSCHEVLARHSKHATRTRGR
jgi:hypothetical protein